jgi:hypothetical protein
VAGGGEPRHVEPDLGDERFGGAAADAWDGVQAIECRLKRAKSLLHFGIELLDELVECIEVSQLLSEQEALMRSELTDERAL